jgi:hypothetical protein
MKDTASGFVPDKFHRVNAKRRRVHTPAVSLCHPVSGNTDRATFNYSAFSDRARASEILIWPDQTKQFFDALVSVL